MSKQFMAVLAVIVLIFVGIFAFSNKSSNTSGSNSSTTKTNGTTNHVEGLGKDGVTLVEYGDFQCPYCGEFYPTIKQVVQDNYNNITFQFRNFPLVSIHQNAFAGARAAEAASLMGKYWQMHDLLYEQNDIYYESNETATDWISSQNPITYFDQYAKQLGLNVTTFNQDYQSDTVNNYINADMSEGNKLGIDATPTFYLDGKQLQSGQYTNTVASFQKLINAAIAQKTKKS